MTKRTPFAVLAVVASLGLAACGEETLEQGSIEDNVKSQYKQVAQKDLKEVSCPDDASAKKGTKFECEATTASGKKIAFKFENTDDEGNSRITNEDKIVEAIAADS